MKKGKLLMTVIIGMMCVILTSLIFIQFKTISQTDISSLDTMREQDLRDEITNLKAKYVEVQKQIEETEELMTEYEDSIASGKEASETLIKERNKQNDLLGKDDVQGDRNSSNTNRQ